MKHADWSDDVRELPEWIEQDHVILRDGIDDHGIVILKADAITLLFDHPDFPDESGDAEYFLEILKNSGWTYEVDAYVRITGPDWLRHLS
jgi:hypothetical protein